MKIAALLTAAAATTVVSGNSFRDPKTVVQKQKENKRALTETERRLAVSLMSHVFARLYANKHLHTPHSDSISLSSRVPFFEFLL